MKFRRNTSKNASARAMMRTLRKRRPHRKLTSPVVKLRRRLRPQWRRHNRRTRFERAMSSRLFQTLKLAKTTKYFWSTRTGNWLINKFYRFVTINHLGIFVITVDCGKFALKIAKVFGQNCANILQCELTPEKIVRNFRS